MKLDILSLFLPFIFPPSYHSLGCSPSFSHHQMSHSGRMDPSHNALQQQQQQHQQGLHGNQSIVGGQMQQRNSNTQNARLQAEGSFGQGGPGGTGVAGGGEGADHALDVSHHLSPV